MNESAVGIDVSKLKLDVCIIAGTKLKYKVVKNIRSGHAELVAWLVQRKLPVDVPVVLEATGAYSEAAATALTDAGWKVSVVNQWSYDDPTGRSLGCTQGAVKGALHAGLGRKTPQPGDHGLGQTTTESWHGTEGNRRCEHAPTRSSDLRRHQLAN